MKADKFSDAQIAFILKQTEDARQLRKFAADRYC